MSEYEFIVRNVESRELRPYIVEVAWAPTFRNALAWLYSNLDTDTFTEFNDEPRWAFDGYRLAFKEEIDRTAFLLRFS